MDVDASGFSVNSCNTVIAPPVKGQEFVPSATSIAAVDLSLSNFGTDNPLVTVEVRHGTQSGALVTSVTQNVNVAGVSFGNPMVHIDFPTPGTLIPGKLTC